MKFFSFRLPVIKSVNFQVDFRLILKYEGKFEKEN